jgi:hypothetical protein
VAEEPKRTRPILSNPLGIIRTRVKTLPHLGQALIFASMLTAALAVLYLLVLAWWPWTWGYPHRIDGSLDPAGVFAMQLAFGQVFTGFAGVFLAGTLGFFAIREFTTAQARPALRVAWVDPLGQETELLSLVVEEDASEPLRFSLAIHNEGDAVAVWYQVEFHCPFLMQQQGAEWVSRGHWTPVPGEAPANWLPFQVREGNGPALAV